MLVREPDSPDYRTFISSFIDEHSPALREVSLSIHSNPELGYKEFHAVETLCSFLQSRPGWTVQQGVYGIYTAFVARFGEYGDDDDDGAHVSFNAEYDALPGIGHACGHNLIAMSSLAAAIALSAAMESFSLRGKVYLVGTPAEEGGGGKIQLINAGLYKDHPIDVSMMSHPANADVALCHTPATQGFKVEAFGREAHAAMCPHEGINALDALVIGYTAVSALRQQLKRGDVISGIIRSGGTATNIIPAYASAEYFLRSNTRDGLEDLSRKLSACFEAGAVATGASVKLTSHGARYEDHNPSRVLGRSYREHFNGGFGGQIPSEEVELMVANLGGATDQGNVSHVVPSLHSVFAIPSETGPHNPKFANAAKTENGHKNALRAAKAMALVAIDILTRESVLKELREERKHLAAASEVGNA